MPDPSPSAARALALPWPARAGARTDWPALAPSVLALALTDAAARATGPVLAVVSASADCETLADALRFFDPALPVLTFPDWETLPYDAFSPHQDLVSERLATLARLPGLRGGIVIVPITTLMQRLAPRAYLDGTAFNLRVGERLDLEALRTRLAGAGYTPVTQVYEHGEFAIRGGLVDLFPMGSETPLRIELDDDEIASIRSFEPDTQRSHSPVTQVALLPGREFPVSEAALDCFYQRYMEVLDANPTRSPLYRDLKAGRLPAGIEFYLPLFFPATATLLDHLPPDTVVAWDAGAHAQAEAFWATVKERHEARAADRERPPLPPGALYLDAAGVFGAIKPFAQVALGGLDAPAPGVRAMPQVAVRTHAGAPLADLETFLAADPGRTLLVAESPGRRETLTDMLARRHIHPQAVDGWASFIASAAALCITVAPLTGGAALADPPLTVLTERELYGEAAVTQRRRDRRETDPDAVIRNLAELAVGDAVVHIEHGVGRYRGLETLTVDGTASEYLALEYAERARIYVPVARLDLVHRYTGADSSHAPLHKLGSGQWERARRKAREQVRDTAAELLALYARRAAQHGQALRASDDYAAFAAGFAYEETPDQARAIREVVEDLGRDTPMDRVVCGDVGFGKTEVALRAAFVAASAGQQVAVLVPTTLLAEQHGENFRTRFADWPLRVEALSRFQSKAEQQTVLDALANGKVDVVIGTHRLLQKDIRFARLGLVIIDEEHRFGVQHKERLKALRAQVHSLTLTATPIPRTLSFALAGLRGLSIIATPPPRRLAVRTFVRSWDSALLREACLREFKRGGQVYLLHNRVETIERVAGDIARLVPEANLRVAHGQLPERELERIMRDFYHRRFNLLVCTTIIESGIDVPTANTIIIDRADRLGLAELHQLRGRVGRSHHQAYAYLLVPDRQALAGDALKRLEAIEQLGDLGIGFALATHDMEIRGAGELLGESQSGHVQEVGFTLYHELLERAVADLKAGRTPQADVADTVGTEVELSVPALLPSDYVADVHTRLTLYQRVSAARDAVTLTELQEEVVDRFGPLPAQARSLFGVAGVRVLAQALGAVSAKANAETLNVVFGPQPNLNVEVLLDLVRSQPRQYRLQGQTRLHVVHGIADPAARLERIRDLLEGLSPNGVLSTRAAKTAAVVDIASRRNRQAS